MENKINKTAGVAALFGVVVAMPIGVANAQAATPNALGHYESAAQVIKDFQGATGAQIVVSDDLDTTSRVFIPAAGFKSRAQKLNALAASLNCEWHKVYTVSPSDAKHPQVALADAYNFADGSGKVSFQGSSLPGASAITAVAQADGAAVDISGYLPRYPVSLNVENLNVPQAIALVSSETNTNWTLGYRLQSRSVNLSRLTSFATSENIVPRHMPRRASYVITDAVSQIPGYYRPFWIHMPAPSQSVTTSPQGVVMYVPSQDDPSTQPPTPLISSPVGSGLSYPGAGPAAYDPFAYNGAAAGQVFGGPAVVSSAATSATAQPTSPTPQILSQPVAVAPLQQKSVVSSAESDSF